MCGRVHSMACSQDAFDHDKEGQKSAISGRRLSGFIEFSPVDFSLFLRVFSDI